MRRAAPTATRAHDRSRAPPPSPLPLVHRNATRSWSKPSLVRRLSCATRVRHPERTRSRRAAIAAAYSAPPAAVSTSAARQAMIEGVGEMAGGSLDGVVVCAGGGPNSVEVSYFGAVATLAGLRPLLAAGTKPAAVAVSSNSLLYKRREDGVSAPYV